MISKQQKEQKTEELELSTAVKREIRHLRLSRETINLFHEGLLNQAEESLKIAELSYKQGEISLIDYLDSQRTYYSILKDYQLSLFDWNIKIAALEKAVGGELK